jgi:DNA-binding transcriptional regulator YdaS (Cro superfamily)
MTTKAPIELLLTHASQAEIARALQISQSAVCQWKLKGIPPHRVLALEKILNGKMTRYQLCPEFYPEP